MSKCKAVMDGDKITNIQVKTKQKTDDRDKKATVVDQSSKKKSDKNTN